MGRSVLTEAQTSTIEKRIGFGLDPFLLVVVVVILGIGIAMVTSSGYIIAAGKFGDGFYYTKKQAFAMIIGLVFMYLFSMVNPSVWKRTAGPIMAIGFLLLGLVFIPGLGVEMGGSRRWLGLPLGYYLQPSEPVKFALVIFMARLLSKEGKDLRDFTVGLLPSVIAIGAVVLLVLAQPDFGTAVIITVVGFLMLFVAGVRLQHLVACALFSLPLLYLVAISAQYRLSRLKGFLDPWSDPLNSGYHIIQSLLAFGCGGLWGVGIGKGIQKLFYLPQPHTDFIFSVVGEELGLFGAVLLILLFYVIVCRGFVVAIRSADSFQKYLAFGITSLVGLQAMVNMAVAMGILPTKGLPLPLVSLGGTSLITNLAGLGILMAITKHVSSPAKEVRS